MATKSWCLGALKFWWLKMRNRTGHLNISATLKPTRVKLLEDTKIYHKSNLVRTQQPMGVRDASGHGMIDRRFDLMEALFAVLYERNCAGDLPKPFRRKWTVTRRARKESTATLKRL